MIFRKFSTHGKSIFRKRGFFRGESLEERNVFLSLLKTREIHGVWISFEIHKMWISWWREKFLFAPNKLFQVLLASMLGQSVANAPRLENTSPVPLLKAGFEVTRIRRERGAHGRSARRVSVLALLPTLFVIIPSPEGLLLVILEQKRQKRTILSLIFVVHTQPPSFPALRPQSWNQIFACTFAFSNTPFLEISIKAH